MPSDSPELINGDDRLTPHQRDAYMAFHRARNATNSAASRSARIRTLPAPASSAHADPGSTPARVATLRFFEWAARHLAPAFAGRDVTIVDLGCGTGRQLVHFESAGFRGTYIGIEISRHSAWKDGPTPRFRRELRVADAHTFNPATLPPFDLLISSTALEHLRDDAHALGLLRSRMSADGAEIHVVPGEASLDVYGPHGWRQYSPACLSRLFPGADLFRLDGPLSRLVQRLATSPAWDPARSSLARRRPSVYRFLRDAAITLDRAIDNPRPTMYGILARRDANSAAPKTSEKRAAA